MPPRRGHAPFSSPSPCQVSVCCWAVLVLDQACKLSVRETAADREMTEESHGSCHCDPRGGLAGRASLLCSGVQAKPSLWGWLLATPFCMGGNLLTGDNVTLKLLLQRCNVWFTCFLPPVPFHSPHLFYKSLRVSERNWAVNLTCGSAARVRAVCGSQMDSKMDGVTGHPHETHQEHIKQNSNLSSQCKLDTSLLATANPLGRHAQQLQKGSNQKAIKCLTYRTQRFLLPVL